MAKRRRMGRSRLTRTVRIGSRDFEDAITASVEEMILDVEDQAIENSRKAGERCVELLRARSRRSGRPGKAYADGWVAEMTITRYDITVTVHNRSKPSLTHLLEMGHDVYRKKGGAVLGRAAGDGIIKKTADEVDGFMWEGYD